jgi:hypothetical protein
MSRAAPALPALDPRQMEALALIERARRDLWQAFLRLEMSPAEQAAQECWFTTRAARDQVLAALGVTPPQWVEIRDAVEPGRRAF